MLSIIVAVAENNVIGKDNSLIWKLPNDLKRFKEITTGHTIIMGRKTFESLGRVLPNRKHVILTRNMEFESIDENIEIVRGVEELQKYIDSPEECFVIGGAIVYELLMPFVNKIYLTKINEEFKGDAFFPDINYNEWNEISREKGIKDDKNNYDYEYITLIRK